ncbi:MAG: HAMP domain-containing histidine kinase [Myxococcales bacterium]|nr:HAMP domain-containing histidine kinase [Myxococcales bacterium]
MASITRSISLPIVLSSVAVTLSVALLVGWTLLIARNQPLADDFVANTWLLVIGIVSLVVIMTVLVLFSVFLVREIREVRRQTSFIDSVTHELKSPLAALKLCLETMARPDLPAPQHVRLREMMLDDVERLTGFIDRVLAATRLPAERSSQPLKEVALAVLARRCAAVVTRRAHQAEVVVKVEVPPDLTLTTDEPTLAAVLENLLDNAVKYSQQVVDVELSARPGRKGQVVIEVRDRGIGIERADLRRVFERFYRAPNEDVRSRRGTGLGLVVVSTLVRSLGGKVTAESAGAGQGTTMRVVLPSRPRTRALRLG